MIPLAASAALKAELSEKSRRAFGFTAGKATASECCRLSFFAAALLFAGLKDPSGGIRIRSKNESFLDLCATGLATLFSLSPIVTEHALFFPPSAQLARALRALHVDDTALEPPVLLCGDCAGYFLRGAFLSCGALLSPERGYHLELQTKDASELFFGVITAAEIPFRRTMRRGKPVFYLKSAEAIEDFLTRIGAGRFAMNLMDAQMEKNMRALVNRQNNFDTANLSRTLESNRRLVAAIEKLKEDGRYDLLPPTLKDVARARTRYPDDTLGRLGERLNPKLSKSGLHHRIKKIIDFAEKKGGAL